MFAMTVETVERMVPGGTPSVADVQPVTNEMSAAAAAPALGRARVVMLRAKAAMGPHGGERGKRLSERLLAAVGHPASASRRPPAATTSRLLRRTTLLLPTAAKRRVQLHDRQQLTETRLRGGQLCVQKTRLARQDFEIARHAAAISHVG